MKSYGCESNCGIHNMAEEGSRKNGKSSDHNMNQHNCVMS